jgi:ABC-type molybdate transport system substrate-binding protein
VKTPIERRTGLRWRLMAAGALLPVALVATIVAMPVTASAAGGSVSLVAYSTPKPAYTALTKAFSATTAGSGVTFSQSFGASGSQATAVVSGLPADVVNFSLAPDMNKLVKAGLVASTWANGPTKGIVTNSIVSFVVRQGNPKNIKTWADLVKGDVKVITPNPFSSGSAKWNLMAAYGAQIASGKSKAQAGAYLTQLLKHTAAQPSSASNALQTFDSGEGRRAVRTAPRGTDHHRHSSADHPHSEPDRSDDPRRRPRRGQGIRDLPALTGRAEGLGSAGLPARPALCRSPVQVPPAGQAVHHRQPRRLDEGQLGVLHARDGDGGHDRAGAGRLDRQWLT